MELYIKLHSDAKHAPKYACLTFKKEDVEELLLNYKNDKLTTYSITDPDIEFFDCSAEHTTEITLKKYINLRPFRQEVKGSIIVNFNGFFLKYYVLDEEECYSDMITYEKLQHLCYVTNRTAYKKKYKK